MSPKERKCPHCGNLMHFNRIVEDKDGKGVGFQYCCGKHEGGIHFITFREKDGD